MTLSIVIVILCVVVWSVMLFLAVRILEKETKRDDRMAALAAVQAEQKKRIDALEKRIEVLETKSPEEEVEDAVRKGKRDILLEYINAVTTYSPYGDNNNG